MKRFFINLGKAIGLVSEATDFARCVKSHVDKDTLTAEAVLRCLRPELEDAKQYIGPKGDAAIDNVTQFIDAVLALDIPFEGVIRLLKAMLDKLKEEE